MEKKDFKKELEKSKKQAEEYLNGWQRTKADFENYKKRQAKIFGELEQMASQNLILEILPILDAFKSAGQHLPEELKNSEWAKGILQIKNQLESLLEEKGLEEIKSIGEIFNPNLHEVVEKVELDNKKENEIIEEIQKGYFLNKQVIRTAKVKIAKCFCLNK
jgi:molecular chaperone GrpE